MSEAIALRRRDLLAKLTSFGERGAAVADLMEARGDFEQIHCSGLYRDPCREEQRRRGTVRYDLFWLAANLDAERIDFHRWRATSCRPRRAAVEVPA